MESEFFELTQGAVRHIINIDAIASVEIKKQTATIYLIGGQKIGVEAEEINKLLPHLPIKNHD